MFDLLAGESIQSRIAFLLQTIRDWVLNRVKLLGMQ